MIKYSEGSYTKEYMAQRHNVFNIPTGAKLGFIAIVFFPLFGENLFYYLGLDPIGDFLNIVFPNLFVKVIVSMILIFIIGQYKVLIGLYTIRETQGASNGIPLKCNLMGSKWIFGSDTMSGFSRSTDAEFHFPFKWETSGPGENSLARGDNFTLIVENHIFIGNKNQNPKGDGFTDEFFTISMNDSSLPVAEIWAENLWQEKEDSFLRQSFTYKSKVDKPIELKVYFDHQIDVFALIGVSIALAASVWFTRAKAP